MIIFSTYGKLFDRNGPSHLIRLTTAIPTNVLPFIASAPYQQFHPLFMGPDYIGPAVDHFQEITAQYPEVRTPRNELLEFLVLLYELRDTHYQ